MKEQLLTQNYYIVAKEDISHYEQCLRQGYVFKSRLPQMCRNASVWLKWLTINHYPATNLDQDLSVNS